MVTPSSIQLSQPCKLYEFATHPWLDGNSALTASAPSHHEDIRDDNSTTILKEELAKANALPSTSQTLESLRSARSSSSSLSSSGTGTGEGSIGSPQTAANVTSTSRPKLKVGTSELQQHSQTVSIVNERSKARKRTSTERKRRCVSASPVAIARARWTSPDRFVSQRPRLHETSSYHVTKPPCTLTGRELHNRARDPSANPFRSLSESRVRQASRRTPSSSYGLRPPRYVPSFVHGDTAGPVNLDPRRGPDASRRPSWTGFWNVGGTGVSQFGQLRGVPTGDGRSLASGTNAPMHHSAFLDDPSQSDLLSAHEARMALVLNIDQAARILTQSAKVLQGESTRALESREMAWRNGAWTRHYSQNGKLSRLSLSGC